MSSLLARTPGRALRITLMFVRRRTEITRGKAMKNLIQRFIREEDGQDIIEYALLAAFISIAAILAIKAIGPKVNTYFTNVQNALT